MDYGVSAADAAAQKNWLTVGENLLKQYGVGELWNDYRNLITSGGYDSSTAMLAMQSTDSWKNRFAANQTRLKQGLPVLSPADYLATEAKYKEVMISAGISPNVYNNNKLLGDIMTKDVSPYEMQQRLNAGHAALDEKDSYVLDQLSKRFGLTKGDMVLHMLDPDVASSVIANKVSSARIGAEAARFNFGATTEQADSLAAQGFSQAQAHTGFGDLSQMTQFGQQLPGDTSGSLTSQELINAEFQTDANSMSALKRVKDARVAGFQTSGNLAASQGGVSGAGTANIAT